MRYSEPLPSRLPVVDLRVTSGTLGRSEGGCSVRSVRIPPRLSLPSLDRNYIIAACDLILLKEHFEVSFLSFLVSSPTLFNVEIAHIKSFLSPKHTFHLSLLSISQSFAFSPSVLVKLFMMRLSF